MKRFFIATPVEIHFAVVQPALCLTCDSDSSNYVSIRRSRKKSGENVKNISSRDRQPLSGQCPRGWNKKFTDRATTAGEINPRWWTWCYVAFGCEQLYVYFRFSRRFSRLSGLRFFATRFAKVPSVWSARHRFETKDSSHERASCLAMAMYYDIWIKVAVQLTLFTALTRKARVRFYLHVVAGNLGFQRCSFHVTYRTRISFIGHAIETLSTSEHGDI